MARTNKAKRIALDKMQAECDTWNTAHPVGTDVMLDKDFCDEPFPTKTRTTAQILSGHSVVIWLENVSGCYLLSHVTPARQSIKDRNTNNGENTKFALTKAFEMLSQGVQEGWVDLTFHNHLREDFEAIRESLQQQWTGIWHRL